MKKLLFILFASLAFNFIQAQSAASRLAVGAGATSNLYLGNGNFLGGTIRATFNVFDRGTAYVGFNRTVSKTFRHEAYGNAYSSATIPSNITVGYTDKIAMNEINAGFQLFVGKENRDPFGFYFHLGIGIVMAPVVTTVDPYDHNYDLGDIQDGKITYSGFTLNGGIGLQFQIGPGHLFLEPRIALPANQVNGTYVYNPIPFSAGALLGYKVYFGKDD